MDFNKLTIKSQEAVAAAQDDRAPPRQPRARPPTTCCSRCSTRSCSPTGRAFAPRPSARSPRCPSVQGGQQQPNASAAFSRVLDRPTPSASGSRTTTSRPSTSSSRSSRCRATRSRRGSSRCAAVSASRRRIRRAPTRRSQKFGRDLTEAAEAGKLDPVIGRDEEIRRVIQILSRRTKNNPVLIGEPGVGKTAIAEGLAQRIVARRRPRRA